MPTESIASKKIIEAVLGTVTPDSFGGKVSAEAVRAATDSPTDSDRVTGETGTDKNDSSKPS